MSNRKQIKLDAMIDDTHGCMHYGYLSWYKEWKSDFYVLAKSAI
jgi:hypothetical protein